MKITLRFRGREMAHGELGMAVLQRVQPTDRRDRQGRAASAHGRPPDADGAGAQISDPDAIGPRLGLRTLLLP